MDNECSCPSLAEIGAAFRQNVTTLSDFCWNPHLKETQCLSDFLFGCHKLYSPLSQTLYPSRGLQSTALTSSFYLNITVTFISYSIRYDSHRSLLKLKLELRKPTKHSSGGLLLYLETYRPAEPRPVSLLSEVEQTLNFSLLLIPEP